MRLSLVKRWIKRALILRRLKRGSEAKVVPATR